MSTTGTDQLNWGILATGEIARAFAEGLATSRTGRLVAVGSRSRASAEEFGRRYNVPNRHGSYEALLADPQVQAVYVSTPHPFHLEWAVKAVNAGKHVLCEKPLGLNAAQAIQMIEAARANDVFFMEAFMYRCHPQTRRLVELIRENAVGEVRVIQASFSFSAPFNPNGRLWSNALGGGGILDVGCYPVSMSRLVAGVALGSDGPAEPVAVTGAAKLNETTGVDEYAVGTLQFPGGILASVATGIAVEQENAVRIFGTEGTIYVPVPWVPSREGGVSTIVVHRRGESSPREVRIESDRQIYGIEADVVAANIGRRQAPFPAMSWEDTVGNMRTLDAWRRAVGLVYAAERRGKTAGPASA